MDAEHHLLFTGSGEGEMKAWRIDHDALVKGLKETETGEVSFSFHFIYQPVN